MYNNSRNVRSDFKGKIHQVMVHNYKNAWGCDRDKTSGLVQVQKNVRSRQQFINCVMFSFAKYAFKFWDWNKPQVERYWGVWTPACSPYLACEPPIKGHWLEQVPGGYGTGTHVRSVPWWLNMSIHARSYVSCFRMAYTATVSCGYNDRLVTSIQCISPRTLTVLELNEARLHRFQMWSKIQWNLYTALLGSSGILSKTS